MKKIWTEGPWEVVEHSWRDASISSEKGRICELSIYYESTEYPQGKLKAIMEANANLIAAAPELYEALEDLVERCKRAREILREGPGKGYWGILDTDDALDALSKARGE